MGIKAILSKLESLFNQSDLEQEQHEDIRKLLQKLKKKRLKIKKKIKNSENTQDLENLQRELLICEAQLEKGQSLLNEPK